MQRKIGGIEEDVILLAGLGLGGYLLFTHFFPGGPSQQDSNSVNTIYTTPDANNPFSMNFKYSLFAQNPGTYNQAWWINLGQQSANLLNNGQNPADVSGVYNYITLGELLRSAFGIFTIDFNTIQSVFQSVASQADVSNIAAYLYFAHGINLWNLLSNATGSNFTITGGLNTTQLAQIVNEVNNLPASN